MATLAGYGYNFTNNDLPTAVTFSNLTPAEDTVLTTAQGVQFDLTVTPPNSVLEADGARIAVWVRYPDLDNKTEVVFDGTAFTSTFDDASTMTSITNGLRFLVYRNGGWISKPTFFVHAVSDVGGINS